MNLVKYIPRSYEQTIKSDLANSHKILMLFGPRQVGKTTLARKILADFKGKTLEINADILQYSEVLKSRDIRRLGGLVEGYDLLFIDEVQRIPDIGINLKILFDQFPGLRILITGSSSLELANQTREALTGRTLTYQLFPVAVQELKQVLSPFDLHQRLEEFLIFGMYPDILQQQNRETKIRYLRELVGAYLYKDILELTNIKHSEKLGDLLRLLAFQIGSQVSLTELGKQLGLAKETVETYLDLLEKSFVIFKLRGFSRNLRKEVSKMSKYYFYDLGVRNTLIENFNLPNYRGDMGQLWENFLMVERLKYQAYTLSASNKYFWRTYDQQELDYLEEYGGRLSAYEFKLKPRNKKAPVAWRNAYPAATFEVIHEQNYLDFIS
ncbi:MAG: ATP-binding protein [Bacteroidota bacterium]